MNGDKLLNRFDTAAKKFGYLIETDCDSRQLSRAKDNFWKARKNLVDYIEELERAVAGYEERIHHLYDEAAEFEKEIRRLRNVDLAKLLREFIVQQPDDVLREDYGVVRARPITLGTGSVQSV